MNDQKWRVAREPHLMMDELNRLIIESGPLGAMENFIEQLSDRDTTFYKLFDVAFRCRKLTKGLRKKPAK